MLSIISFPGLNVIEIGVLRNYSFTIHYLNGNCSWTVSSDLGGNIVERVVDRGPQTTIEGTETTTSFTLKCAVNDMVELLADITAYGE